ncbi:hypothetical protein EON63_01980 [archaeon]|nr:MAG: hypothetical protein EON63_01980 [archaeon]
MFHDPVSCAVRNGNKHKNAAKEIKAFMLPGAKTIDRPTSCRDPLSSPFVSMLVILCHRVWFSTPDFRISGGAKTFKEFLKLIGLGKKYVDETNG